MAKLPCFFWLFSSVPIMCFSGFGAAMNLSTMLHGMAGGWRESFWDIVGTSDGYVIVIGFTLGGIFAATFAAVSYASVRRHILTKNHILIILIGIALFVFFLEYPPT